jgi:hypothetical protein
MAEHGDKLDAGKPSEQPGRTTPDAAAAREKGSVPPDP